MAHSHSSSLPTTSSRPPSPQNDASSSRPFSASRSHRSNPNFSKLPPLITSTPPRSSNAPRPFSQFFSARSHISGPSARSRPQSNVFPIFHSSLVYTQVRDFFYPIDHHLHYGPPPEGSTKASTPASEESTHYFQSRYVKDSPLPEPDGHASSSRQSGPRLPATSYGDGPPWSEDEDLLSPIVTSSKQRKEKSNASDGDSERGRSEDRVRGGSAQRRSNPLSTAQSAEEDLGEGAVRASKDHATQGSSSWDPPVFRSSPSPEDEPSFPDDGGGFVSEDEPTPYSDEDERSRYSRDYQFTIASPDEEMHGKAVALYDFTKENENELPLLEGQVLWVSYRHGQGWLVASDPKSGESGLVPEEYVRLVRDIEGGLTRLNGGEGGDWDSPTTFAVGSGDSPMIPWHERSGSGTSGRSGILSSGQHYTPVVSHFSTSSKDLEPYPQRHLIGGNGGGNGQVQQLHAPASPALGSPRSAIDRPQRQITLAEQDQDRKRVSTLAASFGAQQPEFASSSPNEPSVKAIQEAQRHPAAELPHR